MPLNRHISINLLLQFNVDALKKLAQHILEKKIENPLIIVIGSNTIERVMTYKLLGAYVSNDLKWNHHVEVIVQKGNRRLYSLRVLKQCGAPPASLAKVYTTIVRPPVLECAAPVWHNIPDFLSYKIESIQKRAMRIIFPLMSYN